MDDQRTDREGGGVREPKLGHKIVAYIPIILSAGMGCAAILVAATKSQPKLLLPGIAFFVTTAGWIWFARNLGKKS